MCIIVAIVLPILLNNHGLYLNQKMHLIFGFLQNSSKNYLKQHYFGFFVVKWNYILAQFARNMDFFHNFFHIKFLCRALCSRKSKSRFRPLAVMISVTDSRRFCVWRACTAGQRTITTNKCAFLMIYARQLWIIYILHTTEGLGYTYTVAKNLGVFVDIARSAVRNTTSICIVRGFFPLQ